MRKTAKVKDWPQRLIYHLIEKVCYTNNTPPPFPPHTCTKPDGEQRGEDLVSMAMTFMDYTFKSPWRQEITTAKIQITDQTYK